VSTLELFGQLIAQSPTARVLLLATARPEFTAPWQARENLTTVQLARLTRRQARDMVMALCAGSGAQGPGSGPNPEPGTLNPDVVDALVARADGVPLYVEELTKAMMEPGAANGVEAIPATLADSLMARLDRLSAAKGVAQRAAVLGREFGYPLLAAIADMDEAALRRELARLIEAEIVFARGEPPAATYVFKHALIEETAYHSLLKHTRQQLHARVVEVLNELFPERVESEPEVVARHCDQAGLAAQAIGHYQRAGERATQRSANEEAIGHLRRAVDLVANLPETRERHRMELGLQMALGMPLAAVKWSHPEYEQTYSRARELTSRIGESPELARVLVGMADAYLLKGDLVTTAEVAQEALAAAEHTGDTFDRLSAHEEVGVALFFQGDFSRALRHFEQTIELYDPGEHGSLAYAVAIDRGVHAHGLGAQCLVYLGHPARALPMSEEGLALAKRGEHRLSLANGLFFASDVHFERGEFDRMQKRAEELVILAEQLGFPIYFEFGRLYRGRSWVESGESEAGLAEMQQAKGELVRIGVGVAEPQFFAMLAESLRKVGCHDDALGTLEHALGRADQQGQHYYDAELHRLRAEVLLHMNDKAVEEAETHLYRSLEIARRQEARTFELRAATSLARLWPRQGKRDDARALLAPLYAWFTEGFDTRDLRDAKALLEELG
jgi:tetratricopeptide (TPR) repeat protein